MAAENEIKTADIGGTRGGVGHSIRAAWPT